METEKKKITVTTSQIVGYLDQGMDRDAIAEVLEVTRADVNELFKHPSLKGKRPRKPPVIDLIDDTTEEPQAEENTSGDASYSTEETVEEPQAEAEVSDRVIEDDGVSAEDTGEEFEEEVVSNNNEEVTQ